MCAVQSTTSHIKHNAVIQPIAGAVLTYCTVYAQYFTVRTHSAVQYSIVGVLQCAIDFSLLTSTKLCYRTYQHDRACVTETYLLYCRSGSWTLDSLQAPFTLCIELSHDSIKRTPRQSLPVFISFSFSQSVSFSNSLSHTL